MVEAAWQGVRRSPTVRAFYQRVMKDDPDRKKIAIVATAHYLTRVSMSMLKSGETWREAVGALPQTPPRKPLPPGLELPGKEPA